MATTPNSLFFFALPAAETTDGHSVPPGAYAVEFYLSTEEGIIFQIVSGLHAGKKLFQRFAPFLQVVSPTDGESTAPAGSLPQLEGSQC